MFLFKKILTSNLFSTSSKYYYENYITTYESSGITWGRETVINGDRKNFVNIVFNILDLLIIRLSPGVEKIGIKRERKLPDNIKQNRIELSPKSRDISDGGIGNSIVSITIAGAKKDVFRYGSAAGNGNCYGSSNRLRKQSHWDGRIEIISHLEVIGTCFVFWFNCLWRSSSFASVVKW